jgi:hypothetical protein
MIQQCSKCSQVPAMVTSLLQVYQDGNPIYMMELLTEIISRDQNLHPSDKAELSKLHSLLAAIATQRQHDTLETITLMKIPA